MTTEKLQQLPGEEKDGFLFYQLPNSVIYRRRFFFLSLSLSLCLGLGPGLEPVVHGQHFVIDLLAYVGRLRLTSTYYVYV